MNIKNQTAGVLLASAAAALFATADVAVGAEEGGAAQVKCAGINSCKGTAECASATNACQGQNSCKGQGWVHASAADCKEKGGTIVPEE